MLALAQDLLQLEDQMAHPIKSKKTDSAFFVYFLEWKSKLHLRMVGEAGALSRQVVAIFFELLED